MLLKPIVGKLSGKNAPQIKLNDMHARVLLASTAEQALRLVKTATPDLLLIEDELPWMSGLNAPPLCTSRQSHGRHALALLKVNRRETLLAT